MAPAAAGGIATKNTQSRLWHLVSTTFHGQKVLINVGTDKVNLPMVGTAILISWTARRYETRWRWKKKRNNCVRGHLEAKAGRQASFSASGICTGRYVIHL